MFLFNGGYGAPALVLHMGYIGPFNANLDSNGAGVQPLGFHENPNSLLDIADLVFVDPVGTGFSKVTLPMKTYDLARLFYNEEADRKYLSGWIVYFINKHQRWISPKFLLGESAGGRRVSRLAASISNLSFNGVILLSTAQITEEIPGRTTLSPIAYLPAFARLAWQNQILPKEQQSKSKDVFTKEVEQFTYDTLYYFLLQPNFPNIGNRNLIAERVASLSGLSKEFVLKCNFQIDSTLFSNFVSAHYKKTIDISSVSWRKLEVVVNSAVSSAWKFSSDAFTARHFGFSSAALQALPESVFASKVLDFAYNELAKNLIRGYSQESRFNLAPASVRTLSEFTGIESKRLIESEFQTRALIDAELQKRGIGGVDFYDTRYNSETYPGFFFQRERSLEPALFQLLQTKLGYNSSFSYRNSPFFRWDDSKGTPSYKLPISALKAELNRDAFLKILFQAGYYDRVCTFSRQIYDYWQLNDSDKHNGRIDIKMYSGGHMLYFNKKVHEAASEDLRKFILSSVYVKPTSNKFKN